MIDIKGIDKATLLAALVNAAQPRGMGWFHAGNGPMTREEAQEWIDSGRNHDTVHFPDEPLCFDYVRGRPVQSDLSGDSFNECFYDQNHGQGAAAEVVARLRARS